jgi:DNA-binding NarL/FixJ family response regulator
MMSDVENHEASARRACHILIAGNYIFRRTAASIVRDIIPNATITEVSCLGDDTLCSGQFFAAIVEPAARSQAQAIPRRIDAVLTPRQQAVLTLLQQGYSNKAIARALDLSPYTVKVHVSALLRWFAVRNRSDLMAAALPAEMVAATCANARPLAAPHSHAIATGLAA